ncbi:hypothetical protein L6452_28461 [Arctium lappa]|uniref:Uncharacterized protein n=1 Tax=Arctium lappa TaxID=4217 RepID=A0ACB8ZYB5_ARCLA|nr:hypothetical protein L6452_28461 [Arctium lappa]
MSGVSENNFLVYGRLGTRGGTTRASPLDSSGNIPNQTSSSKVEAAAKVVLEAMDKENDMPIVWEPCLIEELEVVDISCGLHHTLLGRSKQDLGLLPVDTNERAVCVASGLGHSLAICKIPKTGLHNRRHLFMGLEPEFSARKSWSRKPPVARGRATRKVVVSGGWVHSLALTSAGEVFVWGCGRNGRLGLGSSMNPC